MSTSADETTTSNVPFVRKDGEFKSYEKELLTKNSYVYIAPSMGNQELKNNINIRTAAVIAPDAATNKNPLANEFTEIGGYQNEKTCVLNAAIYANAFRREDDLRGPQDPEISPEEALSRKQTITFPAQKISKRYQAGLHLRVSPVFSQGNLSDAFPGNMPTVIFDTTMVNASALPTNFSSLTTAGTLTIRYSNKVKSKSVFGEGFSSAGGFTAQWSGVFRPDTSGQWKFRLTNNDVGYIFFGDAAVSAASGTISLDKALVSNGGIHSSKSVENSISLEQGKVYQIVIFYGSGSSSSSDLSLAVTSPTGTTSTDLSPWVFAQIPGNYLSNSIINRYTDDTTLVTNKQQLLVKTDLPPTMDYGVYILGAYFGDETARRFANVTEFLNKMLEANGYKEVVIPAGKKLSEFFGVDPSPTTANKTLFLCAAGFGPMTEKVQSTEVKLPGALNQGYKSTSSSSVFVAMNKSPEGNVQCRVTNVDQAAKVRDALSKAKEYSRNTVVNLWQYPSEALGGGTGVSTGTDQVAEMDKNGVIRLSDSTTGRTAAFDITTVDGAIIVGDLADPNSMGETSSMLPPVSYALLGHRQDSRTNGLVPTLVVGCGSDRNIRMLDLARTWSDATVEWYRRAVEPYIRPHPDWIPTSFKKGVCLVTSDASAITQNFTYSGPGFSAEEYCTKLTPSSFIAKPNGRFRLVMSGGKLTLQTSVVAPTEVTAEWSKYSFVNSNVGGDQTFSIMEIQTQPTFDRVLYRNAFDNNALMIAGSSSQTLFSNPGSSVATYLSANYVPYSDTYPSNTQQDTGAFTSLEDCKSNCDADGSCRGFYVFKQAGETMCKYVRTLDPLSNTLTTPLFNAKPPDSTGITESTLHLKAKGVSSRVNTNSVSKEPLYSQSIKEWIPADQFSAKFFDPTQPTKIDAATSPNLAQLMRDAKVAAGERNILIDRLDAKETFTNFLPMKKEEKDPRQSPTNAIMMQSVAEGKYSEDPTATASFSSWVPPSQTSAAPRGSNNATIYQDRLQPSPSSWSTPPATVAPVKGSSSPPPNEKENKATTSPSFFDAVSGMLTSFSFPVGESSGKTWSSSSVGSGAVIREGLISNCQDITIASSGTGNQLRSIPASVCQNYNSAQKSMTDAEAGYGDVTTNYNILRGYFDASSNFKKSYKAGAETIDALYATLTSESSPYRGDFLGTAADKKNTVLSAAQQDSYDLSIYSNIIMMIIVAVLAAVVLAALYSFAPAV